MEPMENLKPTTAEIEAAAAAEPPYMDRLLPWGETGRQAEARLHKSGWREAWVQRWRSIKRANGCTLHVAAYEALKEFPPEIYKLTEDGLEKRSERDEKFIAMCHQGLNMDLKRRAPIDKEIEWVSENLHRDLPDVRSAPSYASINLLIDARTNDRVRQRFWEICLTKRLSPGEKKSSSAFKEDVEHEVSHSEADHMAQLKRLLKEE